MSMLRLIVRSWAYYRRAHAGLFLGAALASAILCGALMVGSSVQGTLRDIALVRLGNIHLTLEGRGRFFGEGLAQRMQDALPETTVASVLTLRGAASSPPETAEADRRSKQVQVLGVTPSFWGFAPEPGTCPALRAQSVAINEAAAEALGAGAGDELLLRLQRPGIMPLDAPMAHASGARDVVLRVRVESVLPDARMGRFGLAANQAAPANVFADLEWLQEQVELPGLVNVLAAGSAEWGRAQAALANAWTLEDVGYRLREHPSGAVQLESSRIFIDDAVVQAARAAPGAMPTLTYLVNRIAKGGRATPYSFVEAGAAPPGTPEQAAVINQWLAEALGAQAGDALDIAFYAITPDNRYETVRRTLTVHRVVSMESLQVERELAPAFPGLSDVETCRDWDIGMPLDEEQLQDEANAAYWRAYGQTPKLLTALKTGQELWGSRFGSVTAVRFPPEAGGIEQVRGALRGALNPADLGLSLALARAEAMESVEKAMSFGGLFIGMSFFLIAGALSLLLMFFVQAMQRRAEEIGIFKGMGYTRGRIALLMLVESAPVAAFGILAGVGGGILYAAALLEGLQTLWPAAVAATPIRLQAEPLPLVWGSAGSLSVVLIVLAIVTWRAMRCPVRELSTTDFTSVPAGAGRGRAGFLWVLGACFFLAGACVALGGWPGQAQDGLGAFFGAGVLFLAGGLTLYGAALRRMACRESAGMPRVWQLSLSNMARRRGRSLGLAAVTAAGCFLVISVSSMREDLSAKAGERDSGTGGFEVYAESALPLSREERNALEASAVVCAALRVRDGDDASCLNLNRARRPRLIGVDPALFARLDAFCPANGGDAVWGLLDTVADDGIVPALAGDRDTAMWGLGAAADPDSGTVLEYDDESGRPAKVKVVGALPVRLSVFQGALLISEAAFTLLYPSEPGYRGFLLDTGPAASEDLCGDLNRAYERAGMDAVPPVKRLEMFYAVESTYLAMFLVLGGFGLLLGAGGAAVSVYRNVQERRREIALLNALGYAPAILRRMLLTENSALVMTGTLIGAVAAWLAVAPMAAMSRTAVNWPAQAFLICGLAASEALFAYVGVSLGRRNISFGELREE